MLSKSVANDFSDTSAQQEEGHSVANGLPNTNRMYARGLRPSAHIPAAMPAKSDGQTKKFAVLAGCGLTRVRCVFDIATCCSAEWKNSVVKYELDKS
ncbi:hypothetical protein AVEN_32111-1 [Araneus ventricosus]|uniref:Uncharacterized protein n=1 Tax=Araneus ventricosus TaxID=182803 RepID=A0A4Y2GHH3_ARAVE|nr:hypothetical protein AVEN_32111-1 [Araneus ventricosus]